MIITSDINDSPRPIFLSFFLLSFFSIHIYRSSTTNGRKSSDPVRTSRCRFIRLSQLFRFYLRFDRFDRSDYKNTFTSLYVPFYLSPRTNYSLIRSTTERYSVERLRFCKIIRIIGNKSYFLSLPPPPSPYLFSTPRNEARYATINLRRSAINAARP